jgi:hypothetical protein
MPEKTGSHAREGKVFPFSENDNKFGEN